MKEYTVSVTRVTTYKVNATNADEAVAVVTECDAGKEVASETTNVRVEPEDGSGDAYDEAI